jgi:pyruvate dehydrogenase E1 component alpha subunit
MPRTTIYEAATERLEILDPEGRADERLLPPALSEEDWIGLYRNMVLIRHFDEKALNLQRQGRMGTWGSLRGQEAAQAGLAMALEAEDWVVPSFREHGLLLLRGVPGHLVYAFWKGDERGGALPEETRCLPPAIPVGSQLLHAVGAGLALRLRGERGVAVGLAGDGASSEGDFHEAMNFAGVFRPKTVFYIQNNQWAISVPFSRQTAARSIAQKAHAYGIPGIQVDGNDVFACYAAAREALDRARAGEGATLVEALTYRMGNHTTADDAQKYRPAEELAYWAARDPLLRMRRFLESRGLWDGEREAAWAAEVQERVEGEVRALEAMDPPAPSSIFDFLYESLPWNLAEQKAALLKEVGR